MDKSHSIGRKSGKKKTVKIFHLFNVHKINTTRDMEAIKIPLKLLTF